MKRGLRRAARWVLLAALGIVLAYEELQWRLSFVFKLLGRLPVVHQMEAWASGLPPYGALALFALPSVVIFPFKLLALQWLASGHAVLGIGTIIVAKVMGTALVARIFQLTRESLLTIGWCRWVFEKVTAVRAAAYEIWRGFPIVRWWKRHRTGFWKRKWLALRERFSTSVKKE
jgi:hypothetical protein